MAKKTLALSKVYGHLEPGPVVLVTTKQRGKPNVMTMSWYTMMEFEPPLIGCVLSGRNYSFAALMKNKQCVINIPTQKLIQTVVACGNSSGRKLDKISEFKLKTQPAKYVDAPLLTDCYANFECEVVDDRLAKQYNFFVLRVVKAHIDPDCKNPRTIHHRGRGEFFISGTLKLLPSRMK